MNKDILKTIIFDQHEVIKNAAGKLCDTLFQAAEGIGFGYNLIPNGFEVKDDGKITQKYIFGFKKNIYTIFDKKNGKGKEGKSFYITDNIFDFDIEVGKKYYELNKKQQEDKKFFVNTIMIDI